MNIADRLRTLKGIVKTSKIRLTIMQRGESLDVCPTHYVKIWKDLGWSEVETPKTRKK